MLLRPDRLVAQTSRAEQQTYGVLYALLAVGGVATACWILLNPGPAVRRPLGLAATAALCAALAGAAAYRLLRNRPRRDGGLLSPLVLVAVGGLLLAMAAFLVVDGAWDRDLLACALMGGAALYVGLQRWRRSEGRAAEVDAPRDRGA